MRVGVIGGGIFGVSVAIELSKEFEVVLYERQGEILSEASTNNHLRHHRGYHYPRSMETALECIRAQKSFEEEYGSCIMKFDHFHAIASVGSKTTAGDYIKFCDGLNLPYEIIDIDEGLINKDRVSLVLKVPEYGYDVKKMKKLVNSKLMDSNVDVKLNSNVVDADIIGSKKRLKISSLEGDYTSDFDIIINATYSNFNTFNKFFGFPQKEVLYELVEMLEIELPLKKKVGLSIFDGNFATVMPRAKEKRFTLVHIRESILKSAISKDLGDINNEKIKTNQKEIMDASIKDYPILSKAKIIRPIYVTRVVRASVDKTDERLSEITNHGDGIYTIFSGKIVTCIDVAKKVLELTREYCKKPVNLKALMIKKKSFS